MLMVEVLLEPELLQRTSLEGLVHPLKDAMLMNGMSGLLPLGKGFFPLILLKAATERLF